MRDSCLKDGAHVPLGEVLRQSLSDKTTWQYRQYMAYDLKRTGQSTLLTSVTDEFGHPLLSSFSLNY